MKTFGQAAQAALQSYWANEKSRRGFDAAPDQVENEGTFMLSTDHSGVAIPNHSGLFRAWGGNETLEGHKARSKNISASTCTGVVLHIKQPVSSCKMAPDHGISRRNGGIACGQEPCADIIGG